MALLAFPFWRKDQAIFGNIFGTVMIFGSAFALIMREHIELDRLIQQCLESGQDMCSPEPSAVRAIRGLCFHRAVPGDPAVLAEPQGRREDSAARLRARVAVTIPRMPRGSGVVLAARARSRRASPPSRRRSRRARQRPRAAKKNPLLKLIEPWPMPEAMDQRRAASETLPLFASPEPFEFTLTSDFKALNKDRNPESKKRYPGELRVPANAAGAWSSSRCSSARAATCAGWRAPATTCRSASSFPRRAWLERSSPARKR